MRGVGGVTKDRARNAVSAMILQGLMGYSGVFLLKRPGGMTSAGGE